MPAKVAATILALVSLYTKASAQELTDSIAGRQLHEITVTEQSARQRLSDTRLGTEHLELAKLNATPALFGETDIIKSMTLLPGVHGESEGAGGFEVRGGTSAQNLIMLDGMTLYNPSHVMGIFSTFNDNAISRATLYKGPIPANFGGATSSVLETALAPGDMDTYHASATVGLLSAKVKAEGPAINDKLSFAVAARRSYVDMFLAMIPQYRHTVMNFHDVTAKMRYRARRGDYIDVSFITARDNMGISDLMDMHWGNLGASVNWTSSAGDSWRFTTTGAFTNYSTNMKMSVMNSDQELNEYIRSFSLNERARWAVSDYHTIEFGFRSELMRVNSGEWTINDATEKLIRSGWQNAVWVNYDGQLTDRLSLSTGVRLSLFSTLSGHRFHSYEAQDQNHQPDFACHTYTDIEPRAGLKYDISPLHNIKAGASVTTQNLHAIRSSTTSFPFDRYALTSATTSPERATQYGIGYAGMTQSGDYDWSVETYYKSIDNVYDYADGRTMFSQIDLERIILGGHGRSYGAEFMFRKNRGRLTGWISYTLSKTQSRIDGINDDRWYAAGNDRRNDIAIVAIYNLNDSWSLSGSWTFSSGHPLTAPDVKYEIDGTTCYYYSQRNGYRTPSSHRLDLSATYTHPGPKFTYQWSFGLYNAYSHYSPFIVYFEDDPSKPSGTRAVQQSLFGIVPSVSYTIKF